MWPGFESWRGPHMWVEFVVGSGFPLSLKTNNFKLQFDLERTDTFQRALGIRKITITITKYDFFPQLKFLRGPECKYRETADNCKIS